VVPVPDRLPIVAVTVQTTEYPPRGRPVSTLVLVCPALFVGGKAKLWAVVRY